jgi:hypothetical protein
MTRKVDPEEFLKKFTLKPVPPGLREKIFPAADKRKAPAVFWTPLQWRAIVAFLIVGCSAVLLDIGLSRLQQKRIAGLLNLPAVSMQENGNREELLTEIWIGRADSAWIKERLRLEKKAAHKEGRRDLFFEFKEEFDGI